MASYIDLLNQQSWNGGDVTCDYLTVNADTIMGGRLTLASIGANDLLYTGASGIVSGLTMPTGTLPYKEAGGLVAASLTGAHGVTVAEAASVITIDTPQDLRTTASPSFASEQLTATSNQLVLGTTHTTTLSAAAPTASRTYTLPDTGANSSIVMTDSAQTLNGVKTFSSAPVMSSLTAAQLVYTEAGDNALASVTIANSNGCAAALVGPTLTFTMSQNLATTGSPSFRSLALTNTTNQLTLGTVTISAPAPTGPITYTIPASAYATFGPNQFIMSSCNVPQYILAKMYDSLYANTYTTTSTIGAHDLGKGITYFTPTANITITLDTAVNISYEIGGGVAGATFPPFNNPAMRWMAINNSAHTVTLAGNTGITMNVPNLVIPPYSNQVFVLCCTNISTGAIAVYGGCQASFAAGSGSIVMTNTSNSYTIDTAQNIQTSASPTFAGLTDSGLTATSLLASDASKKLQSVTISNGNGCNFSFSGSTLTATMTQDLQTSASPTFAGLTDSGLTATSLLAADASKKLQSVTISNGNGCNFSFSGSTLTATMTQDLRTTATPTFATVLTNFLAPSTAAPLQFSNASASPNFYFAPNGTGTTVFSILNNNANVFVTNGKVITTTNNTLDDGNGNMTVGAKATVNEGLQVLHSGGTAFQVVNYSTTTRNSTLDDGIGNMTIGAGLVVDHNCYLLGSSTEMVLSSTWSWLKATTVLVSQDPSSMFQSSTGAFNVPATGTYEVHANIRFADTALAASGDTTGIAIYVNGSEQNNLEQWVKPDGGTPNARRCVSILGLVTATSGQAIQLYGYQASGATIQFQWMCVSIKRVA